jgi:drug/metabolite transporter (DMT)-like permease
MTWQALAVTVPLFFVAYQALSKLLPKGTSVFLINAYASLVGFLVMLCLHFAFSTDKHVSLPAKSLWLAVGIGLLISFGNFGVIKAYSVGAPQSLFTPLFYVALIIYGVLLGLLAWHERLNPYLILGVVMAVSGLAMTAYFRR